MGYQAENLADLVATTRNLQMKTKWVDISRTLQKYVAFNRLMKGNRVEEEDSGPEFEWRVKVTNTGSARAVELFEADSKPIKDMFVYAKMPFRHLNANFSIEEREIQFNDSPQKIVDLILARRKDAWGDMAAAFENYWWDAPNAALTKNPTGLRYFVVKNASTGFYGAAPTGYTTVANLNPSTYTSWKNFTSVYVNATPDDLLRKWRTAFISTGFEPPVDFPNLASDANYEHYTNTGMIIALIEMLEGRNDNLGRTDLAGLANGRDASVLFFSTPVIWVPKLDEDSTNPIYGVNWGVFSTVFLRGENMREGKAMISGDAHRTVTTHVDTSMNWRCLDRRQNYVLATGTSF